MEIKTINKIQSIMTEILFILILALGFLIGNIYPMKATIETMKVSDNSNCSGMDLLFTSKCLNEQLNSFYVFNISNKGKVLNETELKSEGGVCKNTVDWYNSNFKALGFQTQEIDLYNLNNTEGHAISLVYDNNLTSYCILDQKTIVGCQRLGDINKTEINNES